MSDLISRQETLFILSNLNSAWVGYEKVSQLPTIDAVPVKHGKWIWMGEQGDSRHMCSVCKGKEKVPTILGEPIVWEYCPNCGAKMDGERKEE